MIAGAIVGLILAVLMLVVPGYFIRIYGTPRNTVLAFSVPVCFCLWAIAGGPISVDPLVLSLGAGILVALFSASAFSERADLAFPVAVKIGSAIFVGLVAAPMVAGGRLLSVMVIAAAICALISLLQRRGLVRLDKKVPHNNGGLTGNTNWLGAYLLPNVFVALELAQADTRFYFFAALIAWGLVASRCRASLFGFVAGSAIVIFNPGTGFSGDLAAVLLLVVVLSIVWNKSARDLFSFRWRINLWKHARRFISWRVAAIGFGPDIFGTKESRAQDPRYMVNGRPSRSMLLHNDYLQMLFDAGAVYLALNLAVVLFSFVRALDIGAPFLAAALVAVAVNSLAFHISHLTVVNLTVWLLVGRINAVDPAFVGIPAGVWIPVAAILFVVAVQTWGRALVAEALLRFSERDKNRRRRFRIIELARRINPSNTMAEAVYLADVINLGRRHAAFYLASKILNRNDGKNDPAQIYFVHGLTAFNLRAFEVARISFRSVLFHNPKHAAAERYAAKCEEICSRPGKTRET